MATNNNQTTFKVAMLSAAAKDDAFSSAVSEDQLASTSLNVLANDPGGAHLYSLYQGPWISSTSQVPVVNTGFTAAGAAISFSLSALTGPVTYAANAASDAYFQHLAQGAVGYDTFWYVAQMANGAASLAKATVQVVGVNDAPTIDAIASKLISDTSASPESQVAVGGTAVGHDVDDGASWTFSLVDPGSAMGSFAINTTTGAWTFTDVASMVDALYQGETASVSATVTVTDEHGASSTTQARVDFVGVNDAPTIDAIAGATINDTALAETQATPGGTAVGHDVDHHDTQSYSITPVTSAYGAFSIDSGTGAWTFTDVAAAVDSLAAGEQVVKTATVTVTDLLGATAQTTVAVTIIGANDTPEFGGTNTGSVTEDVSTPATGHITCADRDHDQSGFVAPASLAGLYGTFTFDAGTGNWTYTLDSSKAAVQALNTGNTLADHLSVESLDGSASDVITVTINGVTDAPSPPPVNQVVTHHVNYGTDVVNGRFVISDFDANDKLNVSGNISFVSATTGDYGNDSVQDGILTFHVNNGQNAGDFEVVLVGFTAFTPSMLA